MTLNLSHVQAVVLRDAVACAADNAHERNELADEKTLLVILDKLASSIEREHAKRHYRPSNEPAPCCTVENGNGAPGFIAAAKKNLAGSSTRLGTCDRE
jgi:hypothetical protein